MQATSLSRDEQAIQIQVYRLMDDLKTIVDGHDVKVLLALEIYDAQDQEEKNISEVGSCRNTLKKLLNPLRKGEVTDDDIQEMLTFLGADTTSIVPRVDDTQPINNRRSIWLNNPQFIEDVQDKALEKAAVEEEEITI